EWRYNVVEIGAESEMTLRRLEATQVEFDVREFRRHISKCRRRKRRNADELLRKYQLDISRATLRPRGRNVRGELRWTLTFEPPPPRGRGVPWPTDAAALQDAKRLKRRWLKAHTDEVAGHGILRDLDRLDTGTSEGNAAW